MQENSVKIVVRRHAYEEPENTQLEFRLSNGTFSATVDLYVAVEEIKEIGEALSAFPKKADDEYIYRFGSEDPAERYYRFFQMRAYTTDGAGHCALQFKINLNEEEPEEGQAVFSLPAEAAAIHRLGKLFVMLAQLDHKEFHWSATGGEIFEDFQA